MIFTNSIKDLNWKWTSIKFWTTGLHTSFWLFSLIYAKIQIFSQINCPIVLFCNEDPKVKRTFQSEIRVTAESPDQKYLEHVLLYPWRLPPFPACWLIPVGHSAQVFHHPLPSQDSHGGNKGRKRASPPPTLSPRPLSVSTLNLQFTSRCVWFVAIVWFLMPLLRVTDGVFLGFSIDDAIVSRFHNHFTCMCKIKCADWNGRWQRLFQSFRLTMNFKIIIPDQNNIGHVVMLLFFALDFFILIISVCVCVCVCELCMCLHAPSVVCTRFSSCVYAFPSSRLTCTRRSRPTPRI